MALLDQIIGAFTGNSGHSSSFGGTLSNMLGGSQQGQAEAGVQTSGLGGGLGGLLPMFQQAGLGHIVQSWIGTGANQPVSPDQLRSVLGQDQVETMASQTGMASHDFLSQLSQRLPGAVDTATPNGKLPDEGTVSV